MFKKMIVPVDGSDPSWQALQYAAEIGGKFGSELVVVHVIQPFYSAGFLAVPADSRLLSSQMEELKKNAEAIFDAAREKVKDYQLKLTTRTETGHPAERILSIVDEEAGDAIVIGSRGLSGIAEFVLGSVSSTVSQYAKVPVLIIKSKDKGKKEKKDK
jgi:nucleotide-binding universal stress UspA family protein